MEDNIGSIEVGWFLVLKTMNVVGVSGFDVFEGVLG